jgi:hypothetical protein
MSSAYATADVRDRPDCCANANMKEHGRAEGFSSDWVPGGWGGGEGGGARNGKGENGLGKGVVATGRVCGYDIDYNSRRWKCSELLCLIQQLPDPTTA